MPRDTVQIRTFNQGIISSLDEKDIPIESASDSLNIDGDVAQGILQGIPTDTEYQTSGDAALGNVRIGEFIEDNGDYHLIYHDSSANKIIGITDFHGAKTKADLITSNVGDNTCIVPNNKEVHIGTGNTSLNMPKWVGIIGHGQFSGSAPTGLQVEEAVLLNQTGSLNGNFSLAAAETEGTVTDKNFFDDKTYYWGMSYIYDGYQESPLGLPYLAEAAISGATNTTPIVITAVGHTFKNGDWVQVFGVGGNTAANNTISKPFWIVANVSGDTFELQDSVGNGTYTAGGIVRLLTLPGGVIADGFTKDTPAQNSEYYTLTITAIGGAGSPSSFNKRITGVNIYRADSSKDGVSDRGLFRLVATIDINHPSWTTSSANKTITVIDYGTMAKVGLSEPTNFGSATYEQNSGISETLQGTIVNYSLACKGEGYMYVGKCYKSDLPNADRYIFRSKELRFDMFNWIEDFVILPEPITAMAYFNGRLFAFSLNNVYRIHPEMYIEDVFNGAGALGQRSVLLTEYGFFFANRDGAYWMDNTGQIEIISKPIQRSLSGGRSWRTFKFDTLPDVLILYSSAKKYVMFFNSYAGGDIVGCWAFNVLSKRWDFWNFTGTYEFTLNSGAFTDKNGVVYLSLASNTYALMTHTTNKQAWEWYSQDITFGDTRQDKELNKIKADTTGTVTIVYYLNGDSTPVTYTNGEYINSYIKSVKIKLSASAGANTVDSLETIYRLMVGKR